MKYSYSSISLVLLVIPFVNSAFTCYDTPGSWEANTHLDLSDAFFYCDSGVDSTGQPGTPECHYYPDSATVYCRDTTTGVCHLVTEPEKTEGKYGRQIDYACGQLDPVSDCLQKKSGYSYYYGKIHRHQCRNSATNVCEDMIDNSYRRTSKFDYTCVPLADNECYDPSELSGMYAMTVTSSTTYCKNTATKFCELVSDNCPAAGSYECTLCIYGCTGKSDIRNSDKNFGTSGTNMSTCIDVSGNGFCRDKYTLATVGLATNTSVCKEDGADNLCHVLGYYERDTDYSCKKDCDVPGMCRLEDQDKCWWVTGTQSRRSVSDTSCMGFFKDGYQGTGCKDSNSYYVSLVEYVASNPTFCIDDFGYCADSSDSYVSMLGNHVCTTILCSERSKCRGPTGDTCRDFSTENTYAKVGEYDHLCVLLGSNECRSPVNGNKYTMDITNCLTTDKECLDFSRVSGQATKARATGTKDCTTIPDNSCRDPTNGESTVATTSQCRDTYGYCENVGSTLSHTSGTNALCLIVPNTHCRLVNLPVSFADNPTYAWTSDSDATCDTGGPPSATKCRDQTSPEWREVAPGSNECIDPSTKFCMDYTVSINTPNLLIAKPVSGNDCDTLTVTDCKEEENSTWLRTVVDATMCRRPIYNTCWTWAYSVSRAQEVDSIYCTLDVLENDKCRNSTTGKLTDVTLSMCKNDADKICKLFVDNYGLAKAATVAASCVNINQETECRLASTGTITTIAGTTYCTDPTTKECVDYSTEGGKNVGMKEATNATCVSLTGTYCRNSEGLSKELGSLYCKNVSDIRCMMFSNSNNYNMARVDAGGMCEDIDSNECRDGDTLITTTVDTGICYDSTHECKLFSSEPSVAKTSETNNLCTTIDTGSECRIASTGVKKTMLSNECVYLFTQRSCVDMESSATLGRGAGNKLCESRPGATECKDSAYEWQTPPATTCTNTTNNMCVDLATTPAQTKTDSSEDCIPVGSGHCKADTTYLDTLLTPTTCVNSTSNICTTLTPSPSNTICKNSLEECVETTGIENMCVESATSISCNEVCCENITLCKGEGECKTMGITSTNLLSRTSTTDDTCRTMNTTEECRNSSSGLPTALTSLLCPSTSGECISKITGPCNGTALVVDLCEEKTECRSGSGDCLTFAAHSDHYLLAKSSKSAHTCVDLDLEKECRSPATGSKIVVKENSLYCMNKTGINNECLQIWEGNGLAQNFFDGACIPEGEGDRTEVAIPNCAVYDTFRGICKACKVNYNLYHPEGKPATYATCSYVKRETSLAKDNLTRSIGMVITIIAYTIY